MTMVNFPQRFHHPLHLSEGVVMDEADPHEPAALLESEVPAEVQRVEVARPGHDPPGEQGVVQLSGGLEEGRAQAEGRRAVGDPPRAIHGQAGDILYAFQKGTADIFLMLLYD